MYCCCAITRYPEGRNTSASHREPSLYLARLCHRKRRKTPLLPYNPTRSLQPATVYLRRPSSSPHITAAISFRRFALCLAAILVATLALRNTSSTLFGSLQVVRGTTPLSRASHITSPRNMSGSTASKKESVWDYPRPPALEATSRHLRVVYTDPTSKEEIVLADTTNAFRVLETRSVINLPFISLAYTDTCSHRHPPGYVSSYTVSIQFAHNGSHPPTYYLPPADCALDKFKQNRRNTFCEWKVRRRA